MDVKLNIYWCGTIDDYSSVEILLYSNKDMVVGLTFDRNVQESPRIFYSSCGSEGRDFLRVARKYGLPVIQSNALANYLYCFDVGDEIPPETYGAVAEILAKEYVKK